MEFLGFLGFLLLLAFAGFAFWRGSSSKPSDKPSGLDEAPFYQIDQRDSDP